MANPVRVVSADTETALFRPGVMAPELACLTWQRWDGVAKGQARIAHLATSYDWISGWLKDPQITIVGANFPYDAGVIGAQFPDLVEPIFRAYDADRVTDVQTREKLLDIAAGRYQGFFDKDGKWSKPKYSLFELTKKYTGRLLNKPKFDDQGRQINDSWRLRYGELRPLPLEQWPSGAIAYATDDAEATLDVFLAQEKHADPWLADQYRQARRALWLHLASVWGLRTTPELVAKLKAETEQALAGVKSRLVAAGLVRKDGTRDTKAAAEYMRRTIDRLRSEFIRELAEDNGGHVLIPTEEAIALAEKAHPLRLTEKGGVQLDEDACDATGDPLLEDYADFGVLGAVLNKDIPMLAAGTAQPIHTRFNLVASGRSSSSGPNVQNPRRLPGVRECFVPRAGRVFAQADYDQLELRTLAQACVTLFGKSTLGEALNAGLDPHTAMAAQILGISYEEASKNKKRKDVDDARQTAKVANFGFPGGLGPANLIKFAKATYNVTFDPDPKKAEAKARKLKEQWLARWPEMREFFDYVARLTNNPQKQAVITQLFSKRIRGGCSFTAGCNTIFQGLGADASGRAGWLISFACYADKSSPLYGSRIVNYVHDEFITETDDTDAAHEAAHEQVRLMIKGANEFLPDVPAKTDPMLMRFWSKEAFTLTRNGRLVPWAGEWTCNDCKGIFMPPAPGPKVRTCANHTRAWV